MVKGEKRVSEGLKQKIQENAKTLEEVTKDVFKEAGINAKTVCEAWQNVPNIAKRRDLIRISDVLGLLSEAAKQIQEMAVTTTLEHNHPSPEFWKGWNKAIDRVLDVLVGDGKP